MTPDMSAALQEFCGREFNWAQLMLDARPRDSAPAVWLDFVSVGARPVIEAAMRDDVWRPGR